MIDRRDFLKTSVLASAASLMTRGYAALRIVAPGKIAIRTQAPNTTKTRLAATELLSGLRMLNPAFDVVETTGDVSASVSLTLTIDPSGFRGNEEYEISAVNGGVILRAVSEQGLCCFLSSTFWSSRE